MNSSWNPLMFNPVRLRPSSGLAIIHFTGVSTSMMEDDFDSSKTASGSTRSEFNRDSLSIFSEDFLENHLD